MEPTILIATSEKNRFSALASGLKDQINPDIHWAESGSAALMRAKDLSPLLVVIDETLPRHVGAEFCAGTAQNKRSD